MVFFWQLIVLGRLFRSGAAVYSPFLITFTAKFCSPQANQIISAYEDSAWRYRLRSGPLFYLLLLFGCSDRAGLFFLYLQCAGMMLIRLDGSPKYAMSVQIVSALLNIVLDYVMVFPLGMGIAGASIATSISCAE